MRNLILILIAFIAVVTFIRAFDKSDSGALESVPRNIAEFHAGIDEFPK